MVRDRFLGFVSFWHKFSSSCTFRVMPCFGRTQIFFLSFVVLMLKLSATEDNKIQQLSTLPLDLQLCLDASTNTGFLGVNSSFECSHFLHFVSFLNHFFLIPSMTIFTYLHIFIPLLNSLTLYSYYSYLFPYSPLILSTSPQNILYSSLSSGYPPLLILSSSLPKHTILLLFSPTILPSAFLPLRLYFQA